MQSLGADAERASFDAMSSNTPVSLCPGSIIPFVVYESTSCGLPLLGHLETLHPRKLFSSSSHYSCPFAQRLISFNLALASLHVRLQTALTANLKPTGPSCSSTHIPGYIHSSKLKNAGKVFVVSINDPFVYASISHPPPHLFVPTPNFSTSLIPKSQVSLKEACSSAYVWPF